MLEGKTANNIVDRYHRIITGDQNQIELGIIPEGKITITENGTDIDVAQYALADVNAGIVPTGTKNIIANGNDIDVTNYAAVNVNVPATELLVYHSGSLETMSNEDIEILALNDLSSGIKIRIEGTLSGIPHTIIIYGNCSGFIDGSIGADARWYAAQAYMEDVNGTESGFRCILSFDRRLLLIDPEIDEPEYSYTAVLVQAELYSGTWTDVSSLLTMTSIAIYKIQE